MEGYPRGVEKDPQRRNRRSLNGDPLSRQPYPHAPGGDNSHPESLLRGQDKIGAPAHDHRPAMFADGAD
jgi:hypothetical protein